MRQRRRADAVTLSATAELKLCALQREDKDDVLALFDDEVVRREHLSTEFREQLHESFDSDVAERYRGVPVYLGVRNSQDGLLLAWLQIEGVESTKALGSMVALDVVSSPAAATGPMSFRILRLAFGWLHDAAKFDCVLVGASSDDPDPIMTAVGARFAFEETVTFGDGSTRLCQFYSSLRPAAVKRVQAVGGRAIDDEWRWMRRGKLRPTVVSSTLSSRAPVVTDRLLIRPAIRADASAVAATIDDVVQRTNGWTSVMVRNQSLAIERGLAPTDRVICELGAGVVGVIATYTLDQLTTARCQLGFWIGPSGRGKGYGTEAVTAFVEHLHSSGTTVIEASTAYINEPAQRVLEKAGFTLVGGHAHTLPNGERIDSVDYVQVFPAAVKVRTEPPLEQSVQAFGSPAI